MKENLRKEYTLYKVQLRKEFANGWLFSGTLEECIDFVRVELRNREKNDGYDEYWRNADIIITKQTVVEEDTGLKV